VPAAKTYRVAVIGRTGKGNYGHGLDTVWLGMDNVEIVAVADENEKGRADAAARLKAKNAYADYRQMLEKEKPNIVSVADRWLDAHRDMVIACAQAGASMFLEKPICPTLQDADEMIAACEKHHVKLAIAHQTRYSPRLKVIKDMIGEGKLGDILELRGRGKEDTRSGGQDLMVLGTHIMDLIRYLSGDAKWCFARVWAGGKLATAGDIRMGGEGMGRIQGDSLISQYGMANGAVAHFASNKVKPGEIGRFGLQIHGSMGIIHVVTGGLPAAYFITDPTWMPGKSKAQWQEITSAGVGKPEPLKDGGLGMGNKYIVQDLIEAIEKDRQPLGSIYDGRAALEMILAVYESHKLERPVDLPLKNRKHPLSV
jgi:predicted dehydrogenase